MAYRIIGVTKYSKDITIRELINENGSRYFKAVICGWTNFKFTSDNLNPTQLLQKVIYKCKDLADQISSDNSAIEKMDTVYILN